MLLVLASLDLAFLPLRFVSLLAVEVVEGPDARFAFVSALAVFISSSATADVEEDGRADDALSFSPAGPPAEVGEAAPEGAARSAADSSRSGGTVACGDVAKTRGRSVDIGCCAMKACILRIAFSWAEMTTFTSTAGNIPIGCTRPMYSKTQYSVGGGDGGDGGVWVVPFTLLFDFAFMSCDARCRFSMGGSTSSTTAASSVRATMPESSTTART